MPAFSPKLPLERDTIYGYAMNETIKEMITQNLKMLLLTNPGERVMEPDFGVGLNQYLFEYFTPSTYEKIETRIREQVATYMPAIRITKIDFGNPTPDANKLGFSVEYSIPNIGVKDLLEFTI